jgi:hypothetical protein
MRYQAVDTNGRLTILNDGSQEVCFGYYDHFPYSMTSNTRRYFRFNGDGIDQTGNSTGNTFSNANADDMGYFDKGLTITADGGYFKTSNIIELNNSPSGWTFSFWMNLYDKYNSSVFFSSGALVAGNILLQFHYCIPCGGYYRFFLRGGAAEWGEVPGQTFEIFENIWHNVIITYDNVINRAFLYVDGILAIHTATESYVPINNLNNYEIGNYLTTSNKVRGIIDEFIVEDILWDQTMVTNYYNLFKN